MTDKIRHYNHLCDLANQLGSELIEMLGGSDPLAYEAAKIVLRIKALEIGLITRKAKQQESKLPNHVR